MAHTGLVVDIYGEAEENLNGDIQSIAFRADIDALPCKEVNDLPFKSRTCHSHLCGHDGHTAIAMAFVALVQKNLMKIPKNKLI